MRLGRFRYLTAQVNLLLMALAMKEVTGLRGITLMMLVRLCGGRLVALWLLIAI